MVEYPQELKRKCDGNSPRGRDDKRKKKGIGALIDTGNAVAYETVVETAAGDVGTIIIDAEEGVLSWKPVDAVDRGDRTSEELAGERDAPSSSDSAAGDTGPCGISGCLTWSGSQALPLEITREQLIGCTSSKVNRDCVKRPESFQIWYAVKDEKNGKVHQRIVQSQPFICGSPDQTE